MEEVGDVRSASDDGPRKLSIKKHLSDDEFDAVNRNWPQTPINLRVQEIGYEFFEEFARALKSYNNFKDICSGQANLLKRESLTVNPSQLGFNPKDMTLTREEFEELYAEALYTIKHKIGKTDDAHVEEIHELERYVQAAFRFTDHEHYSLTRRSVEAKPPVVILEVTVAEANNLQAKDADGFSDPYCMLGIVPGSMLNIFTRRFSSLEGRAATAADLVPAKFIKSTSVKFNTLQPIWNEKFRFDLEDVLTDKLHLDVWDRDDDFSIVDSVKKLNEVKGMKGLSRYFKQIAQSARTNNDESVDDFMGTLEINLADIPSTGLNQWFDLGSRSNKSSVEGQIRLELNLSTREDKGSGEENELIEMKEHKNLMNVFIDYEYNIAKESGQIWSGQLPKEARTILHQHSIQGDITEVREAICWWLAMTHQFCKKVFPWKYLIRSLEDLENKWQTSSLYREDEQVLGDSLEQCCRFLLKLIDHKIEVTTDMVVDTDGIQDALLCLVKIHESKVFQRCLPFHKSLKSTLINLIKEIYASSYRHYRKSRNISAEEQDLIRRYTHMIRSIIITLVVGKEIYNPIFESTTGVDFFRVAFKETFNLLNENLITDLEELLKVHQQDWDNITEHNEKDYDSCMPIFKLFLVIRRFHNLSRYLPTSDLQKLPIINYNRCFQLYVNYWISIVDSLLTKRLQFINELEKVEKIGGDVVQSSLPVDVSYCFGQVVNFWLNLRWPDNTSCDAEQSFSYKFVKILSDGAFEIFEMITDKLKAMGYYDEIGQFDITEQLCITINNMEQVRRAFISAASSFLQHDQHFLKDVQDEAVKSFLEQKKKILESLIATTDSFLTIRIKEITDIVAAKMKPDIKKFVFRLCWTPEAASHHESIENLMNYLDKNLETVNEFLLRTNFDRILKSIWIGVLEEITFIISNSTEDLNKGTWIPMRLHQSLKVLLDFFHADGAGLCMTDLECPFYEELSFRLESMLMSSTDLIVEFFKEKLKLQENWDHFKYGSLSVRAYYNSDNIFVEVLNAKNLMPMDANGLSDPYVIVEICPKFLFNLKAEQTKVIKKSLNPVFNQSFVFEVSKEMCKEKGTCLVFVIMDHDLLNSNDFSGEVYISLDSLPGLTKQKNHQPLASGLTPINLPLMQGTEVTSVKLRTILSILKMRKDDEVVVDFLKRKADTISRPD